MCHIFIMLDFFLMPPSACINLHAKSQSFIHMEQVDDGITPIRRNYNVFSSLECNPLSSTTIYI